MAGLTASAKQFVEKIKAALPKALLIADSDSTAEQAQDEVKAGKNPNPYEGMLGDHRQDRTGAVGATRARCSSSASTSTRRPPARRCRARTRQPRTARARPIELYIAVTDFCGELFMFKTIAEKVGPDLTIKNWQKTVNSFGKIDLVPTEIASLCKGKYAADDAFRLVELRLEHGHERRLEAGHAGQGRQRRLLHEGGEVGASAGVDRPDDQVGVRRHLRRRVAALDRALVGAEVRRDHARVVADLVGRAVGDHLAGLEAVARGC